MYQAPPLPPRPQPTVQQTPQPSYPQAAIHTGFHGQQPTNQITAASPPGPSTGSGPLHTGHSDLIHDTQFDYYGNLLATCSSDGTCRVFSVGKASVQQQPLLAVLTGHQGPVWMSQWAHPSFGTILATCSYDKRVVIWKGTAQQQGRVPHQHQLPTVWAPLHAILLHTASVNGIAWAPHQVGLALATASSDGHILFTHFDPSPKQWNTQRVTSLRHHPEALAHPMGALSVSFAPLIITDSQQQSCLLLASGGCDGAVRLWSSTLSSSGGGLNEWELILCLTSGHKDWVRDVKFSPALTSRYVTLASCSQDGTVCIRRALHDAALTSSDEADWDVAPIIQLNKPVWRLNWNPMGTALLATTADSNVLVLTPGPTFAAEWAQTPMDIS